MKKQLSLAALTLTLMGVGATSAQAGVVISPETYTETTVSAPAPQQGAPTISLASQPTQPVNYPVSEGQKTTFTNALGRSVNVTTSTGQEARDALVNSALSQIGVSQDCTMLVTNSLKSLGINFHDWPVGYTKLGAQVSAEEAKPGDLVYYERNGFYFADGTPQSHIAVYLGDGLAVHGGWNGMGTEIFSVNLPTATNPIFISLDAYNQ